MLDLIQEKLSSSFFGNTGKQGVEQPKSEDVVLKSTSRDR